MSLATSKPIEIATVPNGSAFVTPTPVDGRVVGGRLPNPNFYFPDELEIQFRAEGGTAVVGGPIELDCWTLDVETDTEILFTVLQISLDDVIANDKLPPVKMPGGTRAVSLRTANVIGTGSAVGSVIWRNHT